MLLEPVSYEKLLVFLTDSFFKTSYRSLSIAVCKTLEKTVSAWVSTLNMGLINKG